MDAKKDSSCDVRNPSPNTFVRYWNLEDSDHKLYIYPSDEADKRDASAR